jgi:drug/metabolite transporter (DMT)-like permease
VVARRAGRGAAAAAGRASRRAARAARAPRGDRRYAACEIAIPFTLIAVGEQHVASSLAAILIASMPLMVTLLSLRFSPEDRPTGLRLAGLFLGLAGVIALLGIDVAGEPDELLGALLILVATLLYAIAPLIIQRSLADLDPLGPVTAALLVSAAALLPLAIAAPPGETPPLDAIASLVVLGAVCTALGLVLFFRLIAEAGPSRASIITYVNPLVAVLLGVLVLDERLGASSLAGLVLILAGSWLATGGGVRRANRTAASF